MRNRATLQRLSRLLAVVAALLLPLNVWAADIDKSNSLTIDKDSATNSWTAKCDISVSGIDNHQPYSGRMLFGSGRQGQVAPRPSLTHSFR